MLQIETIIYVCKKINVISKNALNENPTIEHSLTKGYAIPGARKILIVLTIINLFNYIDRYVLSAVLEPIKKT